MNGLLGMGWLGWIVALVVGFVIGGVFFLTMKLQVEYVVHKRGPLWLVPAAMYARLALVAVVLIVLAYTMRGQREKIPAAMLAATAGAVIARVLVGRMVRSRNAPEDEGGTKG